MQYDFQFSLRKIIKTAYINVELMPNKIIQTSLTESINELNKSQERKIANGAQNLKRICKTIISY